LQINRWAVLALELEILGLEGLSGSLEDTLALGHPTAHEYDVVGVSVQREVFSVGRKRPVESVVQEHVQS
jgi:hypothetical protein